MSRRIRFTTCKSTLGHDLVGAGRSGICAIFRGGEPDRRVADRRAAFLGETLVPAGSAATLSGIAPLVGAHRGARAAARACGANPVVVEIPCHRIVRRNGGLTGLLVLAILVLGSAPAATQEPTAAGNEARTEIAARLRSFYFNLAHHDWEALTADILAAKVVAHRSPPDRFLSAGTAPDCSGPETVALDQAVIATEGDWAEAAVPHCSPIAGRDEFRLIWFAGRWRFVAVHLFHQPVSVTAER